MQITCTAVLKLLLLSPLEALSEAPIRSLNTDLDPVLRLSTNSGNIIKLTLSVVTKFSIIVFSNIAQMCVDL
jgi:hypothetical protein